MLRTESSRFKSEAAEELEIASLRSDGTLRNPRTIWIVRDGDDIYVRSVNGVTPTGRGPARATKATSKRAVLASGEGCASVCVPSTLFDRSSSFTKGATCRYASDSLCCIASADDGLR